MAERSARICATALVPLANFSNSSTPMGPFHTTVLQSLSSCRARERERGGEREGGRERERERKGEREREREREGGSERERREEGGEER